MSVPEGIHRIGWKRHTAKCVRAFALSEAPAAGAAVVAAGAAVAAPVAAVGAAAAAAAAAKAEQGQLRPRWSARGGAAGPACCWLEEGAVQCHRAGPGRAHDGSSRWRVKAVGAADDVLFRYNVGKVWRGQGSDGVPTPQLIA